MVLCSPASKLTHARNYFYIKLPGDSQLDNTHLSLPQLNLNFRDTETEFSSLAHSLGMQQQSFFSPYYPAEHFTVIEPQAPLIGQFELHTIRR